MKMKFLKILSSITFCLGTSFLLLNPARADFDLAMSYYTKGDMAKAHREFLEAASFGDHQAQYNVGAMYYRGEEVAKDALQAYAWFSVSAQDPTLTSGDLAKRVYARFTDQQKAEADAILAKLMEKYSDANVERSLTPIFTGGSELTEQFRALKKVAPEYPRSMLRVGRSGFVDVFYSVGEDGTTRDFIVYYASDKAFEREAIDALRQWQYQPLVVDGKPKIVSGLKNRLQFYMDGGKYNIKKLKSITAELKAEAEQGDARKQLEYAYLIDSIPSFTDEFVPEDNANEWYEKSASSGSSIASYLLGRNILYGTMCTADSHKGMGWLLKAAHQNLTNAQYALALEALSGARFEKDINKGFYWMRKAARVNTAAQLRLAWLLTTNPDEKMRNLAEAEESLAKVDEGSVYDKQTLYQVRAAVAAEKGDFKQALKWEQKTRSDAKSLDLPLTHIDKRIASYKAKQPWREAI